MILQPIYLLIYTYLAITGVIIALFRHNLSYWYLFILGRIGGVLLVLGLAKLCSIAQVFGFLYDWLPLLTLAIFYWELQFLAKLIHPTTLDDKIINFEEKIFKCQPSQVLSELLPSKILSEYLHASYLFYYLALIILPLIYYVSGNKAYFNFVVFAECFTFYLCLIFYIFFPVAGPRYLFPRNNSHISHGIFFKATHKLLGDHSSEGTAFPSSHVAMITVVFLCSIYLQSWSLLFILPIWAGITFGVVYCRFHYALDVVFGNFVATIGFCFVYCSLCYHLKDGIQ